MSKEGEEESSAPYRGKSAAKQCTTKRVGKHSQRGEQSKGDQENLQNTKRNVNKYQSRKVGYA